METSTWFYSKLTAPSGSKAVLNGHQRPGETRPHSRANRSIETERTSSHLMKLSRVTPPSGCQPNVKWNPLVPGRDRKDHHEFRRPMIERVDGNHQCRAAAGLFAPLVGSKSNNHTRRGRVGSGSLVLQSIGIGPVHISRSAISSFHFLRFALSAA